MQEKIKKSNTGFTIIEVLIVLAIAGLIMLIVFLAVPALQRSARNNARKNDAGRVSTSINDFVSNNNGNLPSATTDLSNVMSNAGTLGQYSSITNYSTSAPSASGAAATNTFYVSTAGVTYVAPTTTGNTMILDEQQQCGSSAGTTVAGTARQGALLYSLESGSGWQWSCLNVQ